MFSRASALCLLVLTVGFRSDQLQRNLCSRAGTAALFCNRASSCLQFTTRAESHMGKVSDQNVLSCTRGFCLDKLSN